jgi:hypothetical protein
MVEHLLITATNQKVFRINKADAGTGSFRIAPIYPKFLTQEICQPHPDFAASDGITFDLAILPGDITDRVGWYLLVAILRTGDLSLALDTLCLTKRLLTKAYRTFVRHAPPMDYEQRMVEHMYCSLSRTFRVLEVMIDELWTHPVVQGIPTQKCSYIGVGNVLEAIHPVPYLLDQYDMDAFTAIDVHMYLLRNPAGKHTIQTGNVGPRMCDQCVMVGEVCTGGDLVHCTELLFPFMLIRCMTRERDTIPLARTPDAQEVWSKFAGLVGLVAEGCHLYAVEAIGTRGRAPHNNSNIDVFIRKL